MSTTSRVNGSNNIWAALNTQRNQHQSKAVSKVDTDSSASVNAAEPTTEEGEVGRAQAVEGQQAPQGAGGPPPAVGAGGAGGTKGASSSNTTYDPLDTNQDGVVSEMERMVGELREALAGLKSGDANSATAANQKIAELAQKIYAQVAQNLPDNSAPGLSITA
jgi:hypothetical protein